MFEDIEKLAIHKIYSDEEQVYAYKCPNCSHLHYPAVLRCRNCGYRRYPEDEVELIWHKKGYKSWSKVPMEGPCTLLSFTRLWALPVGFDQRYLDFGIVEFKNKLRAVGYLEVDKPKIGMKLKAETRKLREIDCQPFYGFVFVKP